MTVDLLWPGGPAICREEGVLPLGTDAVLLGDFARGSEKKICDLGCGCGIIGLMLCWDRY